MTDVSVSVEREFAVDRATMWKLWTDKEHLSQWMRPSLELFEPTAVSIDARLGGQYTFEMIMAEGSTLLDGEFVTLDEPDRIVFTWNCEGLDLHGTVVTVEFADRGERTLVTLTHARFENQTVADNHHEGWVGCLNTLAELHEK